MFRVLLGIDIVAALIAAYFFFAGLADGSVSAFNIHIWLGLWAAIAAILAGGAMLRKKGLPVLANVVLAILAVPTAGYGLFLLLVIFSGERWN